MYSPVQSAMNTTTLPQESAASLDGPGFMAYAFLLIVITLVAGVMNGLLIAPLALTQSIPRPLQLFLINLLLAGLIVVVAVILSLSTSVALVAVGPEHPRPPLYLCRAYLWLYGGGAVTRLWSLAAFSLSVLAVVRFGKKTISKCSAALIITTLWIVPWFLSLYILLPYVYEVQFVDGVGCFPDNNNTIIPQARFTFLATWITSGGFIPLAISITVPIVCLCYVRKSVVTDGLKYRKGMAKFALFLVLGGSINVIGQILPVLLGYYAAGPGVYIGYSFPAVSLLPTPIIIIAYLKPVQEQVKKMFTAMTCGRLTKVTEDSTMTKSTTSTDATDEKV